MLPWHGGEQGEPSSEADFDIVACVLPPPQTSVYFHDTTATAILHMHIFSRVERPREHDACTLLCRTVSACRSGGRLVVSARFLYLALSQIIPYRRHGSDLDAHLINDGRAVP